MGFKQPGFPQQEGVSPNKHTTKPGVKHKRHVSLSTEQDIKDAANIKKNTNQPSDKETKKSVKRQNIRDSYKLTRGEVKKELKNRKKTSVNRSKKKDTSWLKRTFGSTKSLRKDLRTQQNTEDI